MKQASSVHGACGARRTFLWLWVGNLFTIISLYLRHRGMDSTACSYSREAARKIGLFLARSLDCFRLVFAHSADHNPPYPPLVSALRLVCCLRIQIWLSLSTCCACSHRVFTLGAPCMGLLGPCRLKSFLGNLSTVSMFLYIFIIHQTTQDTDLHSAGGGIFSSFQHSAAEMNQGMFRRQARPAPTGRPD